VSFFDDLNLGFGRKVPLVLQTEAAECGLACLSMLLGYHRKPFEMTDLRAQFGSSLKGVTLKDIVSVASRLGLDTRPLRLELEELGQLKTPCILHWDMSHFVVLIAVHAKGITIHDPAVGRRRLGLEEISKSFTGVALEVSPNTNFTKYEAPPRIKITQLFGAFVGVGRTFIYLLGLAVIIEILALISPLFMSLVVDEAIVSADRSLLTVLALGFGMLLVMQVGISLLRGWSLMGLHATIQIQSQQNLFSHLLNLPVSFFEARHLGDILSRFGSQDTILNAVTEDFIEIILDGMMAAFTMIVMFFIAPQLALIALFGVVFYGMLRVLTYTPLRQAEMEAIIWDAKSESHMLETLRGIRAIKLNNAQTLRRIQWVNLTVETINRSLQEEKIGLVISSLNSLIFGLLGILTIWLGAQTILDGSLSVGMLLAYLSYAGVFSDRVSALIDTIINLWILRLHGQRLADIALTPPEKVNHRPLIRHTGKSAAMTLELRNVSFRYSKNDPLVLDNLSLKIRAGEWVAIYGPSGSGKSTLMKLVSGLLQPSSGDILVNGQHMDEFGVENFRNRIGVVLQEDQLFSGSLADNIAFFSEKPDEALIKASARLASIHDDIMTLPMRYNTLIGDMGTVLSGGQKQRVLMARALYKIPGMLLLDEATSHLDVKNEQNINASLAQLPMTRIVIAHRPETINAAQRQIRLVNGQIEK